mgnify:CR=1 FL=1
MTSEFRTGKPGSIEKRPAILLIRLSAPGPYRLKPSTSALGNPIENTWGACETMMDAR